MAGGRAGAVVVSYGKRLVFGACVGVTQRLLRIGRLALRCLGIRHSSAIGAYESLRMVSHHRNNHIARNDAIYHSCLISVL